jgi:hypothetical protein
LEIPNANGALSEVADGHDEFAIVAETDGLNTLGMKFQFPLD